MGDKGCEMTDAGSEMRDVIDATYGMQHEGCEMTDARWRCTIRNERSLISHHASRISHPSSIIFRLSFPESVRSRFQGVGDTKVTDARCELTDERGEVRDESSEMRDARCEMRDGGYGMRDGRCGFRDGGCHTRYEVRPTGWNMRDAI